MLRCRTEFSSPELWFPIVSLGKGMQRPPLTLSGNRQICSAKPEQQVTLQFSMLNILVSLKTNNKKTEFPNTEAMESEE